MRPPPSPLPPHAGRRHYAGRRRRVALSGAACALWLAIPAQALASPAAPDSASAARSVASAPTAADEADEADGERIPKNRPPLPPLPKAPVLQLPKPDAADVTALDELLGRIRSEDDAIREDAVREILEVQPKLVPAIAQRIDQIADNADRDAMKALLSDTRDTARDDERASRRAAGEKGPVVTPDYLQMLARRPEPKKKAWQDLIAVVAMSRMLVRIGTVEAARELIGVYVRFGEFLRVDTQLQLQKLGPKAVAALIEARRHRAEKIAHWAERQLDALGKAIPGEAVNTTDYQVLADVLRAYGRVRDPDAARIVISFANSERAQVREAARQAVALMADVSNWQLRDTYETIVGKKPPRDWTWERIARELFGEFDRLRLSLVYDLYEKGSLAQEKGDYAAMREAFDKVLTRQPEFEHRADMAPGYLAYARAEADKNRPAALLALYRAQRIGQGTATEKPAQSLLSTLQAEELLERGVADQLLLRRALELDPGNARARDALAQIARGESRKQTQTYRYAAAGTIAGVALIAILVIAFRRRAAPPEPATDPAS